jgi:hypothetical protein
VDGVIVGGWGWVIAAYGSAGVALLFYVYSLFVRRRRVEANSPSQHQSPQDQSHEHGTHDADP